MCGSRDFDKLGLLIAKLDRLTFWLDNPVLYVGDCKTGADALAVRWAEHFWIDRVIFRADWDTLGRRAGPARNAEMVRAAAEAGCQTFVAFWDGISPGTEDCIGRAREWLPSWSVKIVRF